MGSAASIDNRFSEELRQTYLLTEELKEQIATHDARFLKVQSSQAWKDHKKIIIALTERTKLQLQRVAKIYSKLELEEGRNISADIEIRNMLGGSYGDFMRLLVVSVDAINSELLDTALKCIGCDENLIADVLCAIPYHELISAKNHYDNNHKESTLYNIIKSKTLENSSYQKFILKILTNQRQSENISSINEAKQQVDALYEAGITGTKSDHKDDDVIFDILSKCSRQQCHLISEEYEKKYNITLEVGLTASYGGSCLRALILWISPLLSAISSLFYMSLNSVVIDFDQTCHLATKYDKSILQKVIVTYEQIYSESLIDKLSKVLTGNFKKSVIAWFTNPTYDDGYESKINDIIESCDGSIDNLLADPAKLNALQDLIIAEHNSASTHLEEIIATTSGENSNKKSQPTTTASSKSSGLPAPLLTGKSRKNISDNNDNNNNNSPTTITESSSPPISSNNSNGNDNNNNNNNSNSNNTITSSTTSASTSTSTSSLGKRKGVSQAGGVMFGILRNTLQNAAAANSNELQSKSPRIDRNTTPKSQQVKQQVNNNNNNNNNEESSSLQNDVQRKINSTKSQEDEIPNQSKTKILVKGTRIVKIIEKKQSSGSSSSLILSSKNNLNKSSDSNISNNNKEDNNDNDKDKDNNSDTEKTLSLDNFFKKTVATPQLYWLTVSEEEVERRRKMKQLKK